MRLGRAVDVRRLRADETALQAVAPASGGRRGAAADHGVGGRPGGAGDGAHEGVVDLSELDRHAMWQAWTGVGLEACRVAAGVDGIRVESVALGVEAGEPWAVRYALHCDTGWRTRELSVASLDGSGAALKLTGDGTGCWTDAGGERLPALDGCVDVDLTSTAFTNTLPIRRLGLVPGQGEELTFVYITVPGLMVSVSRQRYHCLSRAPDGARYRFDVPATGFTADIDVDGDSLVVAYPGVARRVWSR